MRAIAKIAAIFAAWMILISCSLFAAEPAAPAKETKATKMEVNCKCCKDCKCIQSCKCGGKCSCCKKCVCKEKCECLGDCKCCKDCKCEMVCTCKGACLCCEKCRCVKKKFDKTDAMPAGKNTYIVIGKAEKDGPGYKILLKDGKSISLAATSKTEMHPYWIKPEKLPKVFVKYVNDMGMYQALQIYDAKNSFIDKKWSKNSGYLYSIEKNKKTEQSK